LFKRLTLSKKTDNIDNNHLLAANIRKGFRRKKIRSVDHFAFISEIPASTVKRILREEGNPNLSTLGRIAKALNISVSELLK